ncbi:hypothetical protein HDV57DRAFT_344436 [Trichoderma longibrachiatum]|uniref:Uncharacterized protein n=1 Tax=Trichoderma longibrachiatum ATCC 18648 TaxID=983965 RepID=A0A2T4BY30_TRILO|nr:hypothetical protein M440DRAFT_21036 [Trichoderma longibrachiatum ATCC 18648]
MATTFSLEEKRFVLAEMIKCSTVDIERLARFVESNVLDPKWITMQIPSGRNLEQCMQVADSLSSAPGYRSAMSQSDHLTGNGMNHARQMAPRMSPGGQAPGAMPTSPGLMSPWQHPDGAEDRRVLPQETPGEHTPKKRGRPPRVDRKTAAPPRLANIAPKPPPLSPGPNTPRTILPATSRQADTQNPQPQPAVRALPPLDSPPAKKKRRTATGAASVSASPPLPPVSAPVPAPAPTPAPAPARAPTPYLPLVTTPPPSVDYGNRTRAPPETESKIVRETEQMQPPRPMPLEPEPRHHTLMPVGSAAPPSQIKA